MVAILRMASPLLHSLNNDEPLTVLQTDIQHPISISTHLNKDVAFLQHPFPCAKFNYDLLILRVVFTDQMRWRQKKPLQVIVPQSSCKLLHLFAAFKPLIYLQISTHIKPSTFTSLASFTNVQLFPALVQCASPLERCRIYGSSDLRRDSLIEAR